VSLSLHAKASFAVQKMEVPHGVWRLEMPVDAGNEKIHNALLPKGKKKDAVWRRISGREGELVPSPGYHEERYTLGTGVWSELMGR